MIFDLQRFAFIGEFLILVLLFPAAIIAAIGTFNNYRWAWITAALFFAFVFLNIIFIYAISTKKIELFLPLIATAIAGFVISIANIKVPKVNTENTTKTHSRGKYIASKTRAKYHTPECNWTRMIKENNAVWFETKEEAKKAGYKADNCV